MKKEEVRRNRLGLALTDEEEKKVREKAKKYGLSINELFIRAVKKFEI